MSHPIVDPGLSEADEKQRAKGKGKSNFKQRGSL